ncbi:MAG: beta-N-acetylhexosaminidase [Alphaproteobacteria bacterium CG11_big_fil_rev_8_21_14_0_20_44_7]|nr:MAG: beta-N-acetylhexosaminidase [Alphaproteobacteria bacterium CG11_big_fil_rev_8_21_14_0_20_44_7]
MIKPVIYGCLGTKLSDEEKDFFKRVQPFGFIIFARNIENPEQLKTLIAELKSCVSHSPEILIDQEGGRVQRMTAPHWPKYPPAQMLDTEEKAYEGGYKIGCDLAEMGINVDCAPMLDVRHPDADDIIGDRAFGTTPENVAILGKAFAKGLMKAGIKPVIKHIPGHGRATCDSHLELPRVCANLEELQTDFAPFRALNDMPYAMTAHIIYEAIDAENCATESAKVIDLIRKDIGFSGLIMSDDLSMKALQGSFAERAEKSLAAGCDLLLHCNGDMNEMEEIASVLV